MAREALNLRQAAEHVHLPENELRHFAQRGEIAAVEHGGDLWFEHRALDEWAQRNLLAASGKELAEQHRVMVDEDRRTAERWSVASLIRTESVDVALGAKAKAGVLRDLTDLADRSGLVYDPDALFAELTDREDAASTAIAGGVALPHPRFHDPDLVQETFVAYARAQREIFFGAPEGEGTWHFFLICSTDHELHLHILARLAMLVRKTDLIERLDAAADADAVIAAVGDCEARL